MSVFGVILVRIFPYSDWIRRDTQSANGKIRTRITPNTDTFYTVKFIRKDEKVYILSLFFLCFCTWTYRKKRTLYSAGIQFCDCFSRKLLDGSTFFKFFKRSFKSHKIFKNFENQNIYFIILNEKVLSQH